MLSFASSISPWLIDEDDMSHKALHWLGVQEHDEGVRIGEDCEM